MSKRSPLSFFALVYALSFPLWVIGGTTDLQVLPSLPVSGALMAFCPVIAASILVYRENTVAGVIELLKRSFDYNQITSKRWYVPILLLMPGVMFLAYGLMEWMGLPLPTPNISLLSGPGLFLAFLVAALGEELGWSGYVLDPLQKRWNALLASLILGSVWAIWHAIPLAQAGREIDWIAWWCLMTVALRVLHTWIYNNTGGSVFGATLFHASANTSWQLFPNQGSHYDPRVTSLILTITAALVVLIWGPRTLRR